jgi:LPXTG-motif cell wall-anchored protein
MRRLGKLLVFTLFAAMAAASSALAAGPAQTSYGGSAGNVQGSLAGSTSQGQLPFTGANIAAIAIAGLLLVVVGMLLRRTRSHSA